MLGSPRPSSSRSCCLPLIPLASGDNSGTAVVAAYGTAIGEQKTILLPDGSEVVLNTDTKISIAYTEHARVLHLLRGELHVDVVDDPNRPLSVIAGDRIVQAVGTSFRVEITAQNHVEVLVTDGKVIIGVQPAAAMAAPEPGEDRPMLVPPVLSQVDVNIVDVDFVDAGEALVLGVSDEAVKAVTADEIEMQLSWKEGRLVFRSEPLVEVLAEVERYTTVEFILLDEKLRTCILTGRYRVGDVDGLLSSLEGNFSIAHEYDDEGRVLLSSL